MPQGNAHQTPPGLWYKEPNTSSIPKLCMKSAGKLALVFSAIFLLDRYRSLSWKYTYTNFIGKTMSFGNLTTLTHQPATVGEIDRLKAAEAERKKLKRGY